MHDIPLDVLLSFPLPNYEDPEERGPALVIVNAIFIFLVCVTVGLRIYVRVRIKRWLGSDDAFIVLAFVCTIGVTVLLTLANTRYGWNRHVYDIPFHYAEDALKIGYASKFLFMFAATFTRMSLLCFYYRLTHNSGISWFNWLLHISSIFVVSICISYIFANIWLCSPIEAYWTIPPKPGSTCLDEGIITLVLGIINCVADLLVTILPIPIIIKLHMPIRDRIGVIVLLSLGLIVTVAGIVRTYFIWKSLIASYDRSWYSYPLWIAAAVEIDLGVICASAPALRPLVASWFTYVHSAVSNKATEHRSASTELFIYSSRFRKLLMHSNSTTGSTLPSQSLTLVAQSVDESTGPDLRPQLDELEHGVTERRYEVQTRNIRSSDDSHINYNSR
ncbi:hypothetical protein M501DRAFT_978701 [Patellaria atrata CBS 101060]|uniref:Rhodopsin domain-containing protein n=1 Tax=Patellaria atrata CBS 101060 TaxID=1346257 RepID=A0A9P4S6Q0_9PEZI|nr:hypothetical protein M501DRAFT_978701 [Patellaria atrata CBS 101060]